MMIQIVSPAVTQLLNAPPPGGAGTSGIVSFGAGCLSAEVKSSPARFRTKRQK